MDSGSSCDDDWEKVVMTIGKADGQVGWQGESG